MAGESVWRTRAIAAIAVSVVSLVGIRVGQADDTASAAPAVASAAPVRAHLLNKDDLEAFFDGIIPLQLERSDVAGASVLVMKDGETLLLKGYGYSDLKAKQPVDPSSTIFRLASISKLFTWISAMQLVEQGKLDLDVDVQRYLDFPIKANNGIAAPITLRNLMTHTAGFEETIRNTGVTDHKYYLGLREFLIENQPRRLFEPGKIPAYSNYGVGLGSYIVQRVSGEPFEQYVADHVFSPLGMTRVGLALSFPTSRLAFQRRRIAVAIAGAEQLARTNCAENLGGSGHGRRRKLSKSIAAVERAARKA